MSVGEQENRRYPRALINRPGQVRVAAGPETNAQLIDVAEGGATLFCETPIDLGAEVELKFSLYTRKQAACLVAGEVRHYFFNGKSHVIGVQFTRIDAETAQAIREFVRQTKVDTR